MTTDRQQLTSGDRHILKLIDRDKKPDGWTTCSEVVWNGIVTKMPPQLVELDADNMRVRLSNEGENIIAAMAWGL